MQLFGSPHVDVCDSNYQCLNAINIKHVLHAPTKAPTHNFLSTPLKVTGSNVTVVFRQESNQKKEILTPFSRLIEPNCACLPRTKSSGITSG